MTKFGEKSLYTTQLCMSLWLSSFWYDKNFCWKIDVNSKDIYNFTPLHYACVNDSVTTELINYLVEKKSDVNSNEGNVGLPLHYACRNEKVSVEIIKFLIENKSDTNSIDEFR